MPITLKPIDQQVVVITGASSGIGLATALSAAEQGACLVLAARSTDPLAEIVDKIQREGGDAICVVADMADSYDVEQIAKSAINQYGRIDSWVNDAGITIYGKLQEVREPDNRRLFDTNFWGVVNGSLIALPYLKKQGGALINIGSELSEDVVPLQGMYSASKHAVKGFTDALRFELQLEESPISVTLIQSSAIDTSCAQAVAKAILHAATHEDRDVEVSAMSKIDSFVSSLVPEQENRQQFDEAPRDPAGALRHPSHSG